MHRIGCGSLPHSTGLKSPLDHASTLCQIDFERNNLKHSVLVKFLKFFHVILAGAAPQSFLHICWLDFTSACPRVEIHSRNAVEINWTSETFFFFFTFTHFCCDEPNFLIKTLAWFSRLYLSIRSHQRLP